MNESPRDPYHRADIERLFGVRDRAARQLLGLMPRQTVGSSTVVERADLLEFLGRAIDAEDLGVMLEQLRQAPPKPKRRKLRTFVPRDFVPGVIASMDKRIRLRRGEVTLLYDTLEEITSLLHQLATVLEEPEFDRRFCVHAPATPGAKTAQQEIAAIFEELEEREREFAERQRLTSKAE